MIPDEILNEDQATEPEGFEKWMGEFRRHKVFAELWGVLTDRKEIIKNKDKEILEYYICRACRAAQLAKPYYPTIPYGKKKPRGTTLRDKLRRISRSKGYYHVKFGQLRFKQKISNRCRPFDDPVLYGLIFEIALIVKATIADMDISYGCRPRTIPPENEKHIQAYMPQYQPKPNIRINTLNFIIAELVVETFKNHNHPQEKIVSRRKNMTDKAVANCLDALHKKQVKLYQF